MYASTLRYKESKVTRFLFWCLQWLRLVSAIVGVLTLGFIDYSLEAEEWFLDALEGEEDD